MSVVLWQVSKRKMMDIWKKLVELEEMSIDVGLCWPDASQIMSQIESECLEIREHLNGNEYDKKELQEEIGDLMHAVMSLAWFCGFDSKKTLENSSIKIETRLKMMQMIAKEQGVLNFKNKSFDELMEIWSEAKRRLA